MQKSINIIGAGAWGSALSIALSANFAKIYLHVNNKKQLKQSVSGHPALGVAYPYNIELTLDLSLIAKSTNILIVVPSDSFFKTICAIKPYLTKNHNIAWGTKGLDNINKCFLHESFSRVLKKHHSCIISGPSFAFEVAKYKPTTLVAASKNQAHAAHWANIINTNALRVYTNDDIIGVEIGGAVKNILAIATGISAGLGFMANTQAALITRGLAEMIRLGKSLNANESTFNGLSGLGDLILTCSNDLSRNRRFGKELANNNSVAQALNNINATVEGVNALDLILAIAKKNKVELPICEQVGKVIKGIITPNTAVTYLMSRKTASE